MKTLNLIRGKEQFSIRYEIGEETAALDAICAMVHDRKLNFDWFDAAVMSQQLGCHLAAELRKYTSKIVA